MPWVITNKVRVWSVLQIISSHLSVSCDVKDTLINDWYSAGIRPGSELNLPAATTAILTDISHPVGCSSVGVGRSSYAPNLPPTRHC